MIYDNNCTLPEEYLELIQENGLEGLSEMIRLMVNRAMQFERKNYLNVGPMNAAKTAQATPMGTSQRQSTPA